MIYERSSGVTQKKQSEARKDWTVTTILLENLPVVIRKTPRPEWDRETVRRNTVYASGAVLADPYGGIIYKKSRRQNYGKVERELLMTLIMNRTMFCSRECLIGVINSVHEHRVADNTLNKHINNIRHSLEDGGRTYITTQYASGYKWEVPVFKYYLDREG